MKFKKIHTLFLTLILLTLLCVACDTEDVTPTDPVEIVENRSPLTLDQRSAVMKVGDSLRLAATGGTGEVSFTSSDPAVASVDGSGNVKALQKGHAMITATSGDYTAKFGVLVEPSGQMLDLAAMVPETVFRDVQGYNGNEIVDFAADPDGEAFYVAQLYSLDSDTMISKLEQVEEQWQWTEFMHLYNHGFGYFSVEKEGDTTYLLTESNGVLTNQGTTISRAVWEDGVLLDEEFGDTYVLPGLEGSPRPESDEAGDVIVAYEFNGRESYFVVYDRDALLDGQETNYLHRFACASKQTPVNGVDDSEGRYSSAIRGFAVHDGYIYQLSGSGHMYISVFDFQGNLQYCHELEMDLGDDILTWTPGGISFGGDDLYVAVSAARTTALSYVNVWKMVEEVTE